MKICILGVGKMGSWLAEKFSSDHEVFAFDTERERYRALKHVKTLDAIHEIEAVRPQLLVNCVSLQKTVESFRAVVPFLPGDCILSDIASVKMELPAFYREANFRFVSLHPMFGPTFADLDKLREENAVIIRDSDNDGKIFFHKFFSEQGVHVFEYSFAEHDVMMAYSLTLPFVSSMVFSSCVSTATVPGTTFKRHLEVARGLLSEDEFLLAEIIFNPHSLGQLEKINNKLNFLWHIIKNRDTDEALKFFHELRDKISVPSSGEI